MTGASPLPGGDSTIVAIATAPGRGASATIRVSGPGSAAVAERIGAGRLVPRVATRVTLLHPETGLRLDDALAVRYEAPASFTGEDGLELFTHGGLRVPASVLAACIAAGCRLAYPGEFTRRAVMNGRLDLVQAEAIADLVDARTGAMQRQALAQLDGGLSRRIDALRDEVTGLEALVAYDIDFPEEDDGPVAPARVAESAARLIARLDSLLATAPRAAMLRDGALVVVAGPPNAGKSSLFNALLGAGRALVTPIAGTTRDAIEATLDRAPTPLRLVDTAGLRETDDLIERLGIETSERYLASAAVVLACGDTDDVARATADALRPRVTGAVLAVRTKMDLAERPSALPHAVSAERGDGLQELLLAIDAALAGQDDAGHEDSLVLLTRERHRVALAGARAEVAAFLHAWRDEGLPATVAAVHLHAARDGLGEVTGVIALDDVLDRVFRDFCIGK